MRFASSYLLADDEAIEYTCAWFLKSVALFFEREPALLSVEHSQMRRGEIRAGSVVNHLALLSPESIFFLLIQLQRTYPFHIDFRHTGYQRGHDPPANHDCRRKLTSSSQFGSSNFVNKEEWYLCSCSLSGSTSRGIFWKFCNSYGRSGLDHHSDTLT